MCRFPPSFDCFLRPDDLDPDLDLELLDFFEPLDLTLVAFWNFFSSMNRLIYGSLSGDRISRAS
jgi:hypothetical protein